MPYSVRNIYSLFFRGVGRKSQKIILCLHSTFHCFFLPEPFSRLSPPFTRPTCAVVQNSKATMVCGRCAGGCEVGNNDNHIFWMATIEKNIMTKCYVNAVSEILELYFAPCASKIPKHGKGVPPQRKPQIASNLTQFMVEAYGSLNFSATFSETLLLPRCSRVPTHYCL